jgi:hypothetical protein
LYIIFVFIIFLVFLIDTLTLRYIINLRPYQLLNIDFTLYLHSILWHSLLLFIYVILAGLQMGLSTASDLCRIGSCDCTYKPTLPLAFCVNSVP